MVLSAQTTSKAGAFARFAQGKIIRIDEPYLFECFATLRAKVVAMTEAALRRSSGSSSS